MISVARLDYHVWRIGVVSRSVFNVFLVVEAVLLASLQIAVVLCWMAPMSHTVTEN